MTDLVQRLRADSRLFHPIQHDAADALEAKDKEIAKYKALCDQLGEALEEAVYSNSTKKSQELSDAALAAWRNSK